MSLKTENITFDSTDPERLADMVGTRPRRAGKRHGPTVLRHRQPRPRARLWASNRWTIRRPARTRCTSTSHTADMEAEVARLVAAGRHRDRSQQLRPTSAGWCSPTRTGNAFCVARARLTPVPQGTIAPCCSPSSPSRSRSPYGRCSPDGSNGGTITAPMLLVLAGVAVGYNDARHAGRHPQHRDRPARRRGHPGRTAVRRRHRRARRAVRPRPAVGDPDAARRDAARGWRCRSRSGSGYCPVLSWADGGRHRLRRGAHRLRPRGVGAARQADPRTGPQPAQRRGGLHRRHRVADLHLRAGRWQAISRTPRPRSRRWARRCRRRSRPSWSVWRSAPALALATNVAERRDLMTEQSKRMILVAAPAAGLHDQHRGAWQWLRRGVRLRHRVLRFAATPTTPTRELELLDDVGFLLTVVMWFVFGAAAVLALSDGSVRRGWWCSVCWR